MEMDNDRNRFIRFDNQAHQDNQQLQNCYVNQGSICRYIFTWMNAFINNSLTKQLQQEDIYDIHEQEKSQFLYQRFQENFTHEMFAGQQCNRSNTNILLRTLFKSFIREWLTLLFFKIAYICVILLNPIVVNAILTLFQTERINMQLFTQTMIQFNTWIICLFITLSVSTYYQSYFQAKLQNSLIAKTYNKLYSAQIPLIPTGELITLVQIDIPQITELVSSIINLTLWPFQFVGTIYIYFTMVGMAASVGMVGAVMQCTLGVFYGKKFADYQRLIMASRDQRVRGIDELLNGIATIKQNCYYKFFYDRIKDKRVQEMLDIKRQQSLKYYMHFALSTIPIAVLYVTFKLFSIFSLKSVLMVSQNYGLLLNVINQIPTLLSGILLSFTSTNRLMSFFVQRENQLSDGYLTNYQNNSYSNNDEVAIRIVNGNFKWSTNHINNQSNQNMVEDTQEEFQLKHINITIKKGQTVLVLGNNGSGKTSLIYAILGEMQPIGDTEVVLNGTVEYSSQEPWIIQAPIKSNILMNQPLDVNKYIQALEMGEFMFDLLQMPAGHNSDIGEKGSSLSGGQKKRIHITRSFYAEKDIYLFDSPCSALDYRTGYHIKQNIRNNLKGKTKIIITDSSDDWEDIDIVIVFQKGEIIFQGSLAEMKKNNIYKGNSTFNQKDIDDLDDGPQQNEIIQKSDPNSLYQQIDKPGNELIVSEDRAFGGVDIEIFKSLYYLFGKAGTFVTAGCFCFVGMLSGIFLQVQLAQITKTSDDQNATDEEKLQATSLYLMLYPIATIVGALCSLFVGIYLMQKGITASIKLHNNIVNNLLKASVQHFYNIILASRIKNRLTNDILMFDVNTASQIYQVLANTFSFSSIFIASIALASFVSYPFIFIYFALQVRYLVKFARMSLELSRLNAISKSPILNSISQTSLGIVYIKHCLNQDDEIQKFYTILNKNQRNVFCLAALSGWLLQITCLLMLFMYQFVLSANYMDTSLNEQAATISIYLAIQVSEQFTTLILTYQSFYNSNIYLERCLYLINQVPKEDDNCPQEEQYSHFTAVNHANQNLYEVSENMSQIELMTINSVQQEDNYCPYALELKDINIKYREDLNLVVQDVTINLKRNQKIAIIGRTGSGKTSLTQCITRLINSHSGEIKAFGQDYKNCGINKIRSLFSVVSQDPFAFEGTIKQNLDPNDQYNDEQIKERLFYYNLQSIEILNDLHYPIESNGSNLSLGEKQLIVMFRTILQNRRIVILDECTGNLDKQYAILINLTLEQYMKDKSVIGITHKLEQLEMFDQVLLMCKGRIIAAGGRTEILNNFLRQQ